MQSVQHYLITTAATITDFTADVVKVKVLGKWVDLAKVGRKSLDNPALERV